jgi:glutamate dehydrogenase/leucine dehydrogenase
MDFVDLLNRYKATEPEIVFEWKDRYSTARGWVVINSLRNGAAGGGTRMRKGLTREEVVSLAKVMEIKFSIAGPPIGGAKSGIDYDPQSPDRTEVLKRWYSAVIPLLKYYYGTGGDLNVDELKDVVPITENLGLWHPQEGIVKGHFHSTAGNNIKILGQLRYGVSKIVEDINYVPVSDIKLAVADLITGYGVAESVKHFYRIFDQKTLDGQRAIIQGWGNVASTAAYYLSQAGVKIVGIIDRNGGCIKEEGFSHEEVESLFLKKQNNMLPGELIPFDEINEIIWDVPCDIFIPGAASKIVSRDQVDRMIQNGLKLISCGANVPFTDDKVFFGDTAFYTDEKITLIPDFIANCGMARVFAYLMQEDAFLTDEAIFVDVSSTIGKALEELFEIHPKKTQISKIALENALKKILE